MPGVVIASGVYFPEDRKFEIQAYLLKKFEKIPDIG